MKMSKKWSNLIPKRRKTILKTLENNAELNKNDPKWINVITKCIKMIENETINRKRDFQNDDICSNMSKMEPKFYQIIPTWLKLIPNLRKRLQSKWFRMIQKWSTVIPKWPTWIQIDRSRFQHASKLSLSDRRWSRSCRKWSQNN